MKPLILQLPDSFPDRRAWLERQLVGLELEELVAELRAIQQSRASQSPPAPSLQKAFASQLPLLLNQGLSALSEKQLGLLLKHPSLLTELQNAVLEQGGIYWNSVPRSEEFEQRIVAERAALSKKIAGIPILAPTPNQSSPAPQPAGSGSSRPARWKPSTILTIASALVIGVTLWLSRPTGPTWGFDRSGILTADVSAGEYLNTLATAAGDWFLQRPEERPAVATRLREFIHGCDTLITAPHSQLTPDDRAWLVKHCRTWKSMLESQLVDLEARRSPATEVLSDADDTILKMQNALRRRAREAA